MTDDKIQIIEEKLENVFLSLKKTFEKLEIDYNENRNECVECVKDAIESLRYVMEICEE